MPLHSPPTLVRAVAAVALVSAMMLSLAACAPEPAPRPEPREPHVQTEPRARVVLPAPPPPREEPGSSRGMPEPRVPASRVPPEDGPRTLGPPIEFHVQIDDLGSNPAARGLSATLRYPSHPGLILGATRIIYEWRPEDGKEKQINPATGGVWGEIFKSSLPEMMRADNLARHLATMPAWLDAWVPRDFDGVVCFDVERWEFKTDAFHTPAAELAKARAEHPGRAWGELLGEFVARTEAEARRLRPRVRAWGWYGLGGVHPGFVVWEARGAERSVEQARRDHEVLRRVQAPMPVFYFPVPLKSAEERRRSWTALCENARAGYGAEHLANDGYAYVNAIHAPGEREGQALTREEFRECVDAAMGCGIRRFIVWGVIDGREKRDRVQRWIDEVLTPTVVDLSGGR